MTWNVEDFFETCMQMHLQWVSVRNDEQVSWTTAVLAKTFADALESDFVERYGNQTATLSMCGNITNIMWKDMWNKGVEEVGVVISKTSADVLLQEDVTQVTVVTKLACWQVQVKQVGRTPASAMPSWCMSPWMSSPVLLLI